MCCHAGAKSLVGAVGELLVKGPVRGFPRLQRGSKLLGMGHIYIYMYIYIYIYTYYFLQRWHKQKNPFMPCYSNIGQK